MKIMNATQNFLQKVATAAISNGVSPNKVAVKVIMPPETNTFPGGQAEKMAKGWGFNVGEVITFADAHNRQKLPICEMNTDFLDLA